jgi:2-haloacid dehalogenase
VPASALRIVLLDVNGTLTDPAAIGAPWGRPELGTLVLDRTVQTAMVDALLGDGDRPFSDHIRSAIAVIVADAGLDPAGIGAAVEAAAGLPARPGAGEALDVLTAAGVRAVALTNSGAEAGAATLRNCGLAPYVERVIGVDAVRTFKPHPSVYAHALGELEAAPEDVALLATHPWDLAGAAHAGIRTAWVTHGARGWPDVFALPDVRGETLPDVARGLVEGAGA